MALTKVGKEGITGVSNASDATAITIDSSEKVGIGLTSPQELLHLKDGDIVVGNGTASNSSSIGKIGFSTDASNSRFIGIESFRGGDAANADLRFHTFGGDGDNGERMRISTAGNVGIGTTSPSELLHIENSGGSAVVRITSGTSGTSFLNMGDTGDADIGQISYENSNNAMAFKTNATECMRLTSNGRKTFNGSSTANGHGNFIGEVGSSSKAIMFEHTNGGGETGSITTGSSSAAYNTSSDYRLKENVDYTWDATTRLKQLKPARFNFITDANTTVDGFLAHEAQAVVPNSVTGTKDEVDEDGVAVMQSIDNSKLVPLLVKTIQELEARLTAGGL